MIKEDETPWVKLLRIRVTSVIVFSMKIFLTILLATSAVSALSIGTTIPPGAKIVEAPASHDHVQKDNWGNNVESQRRRVTIRSSRNDTDDVSSDFLWGINAASHGGLLHLEKGKTYVIGTKLDLPVLDDAYVKLDGEIKVRCLYHGYHKYLC